ncbi:MAG: hypothetical protein MUF06_20065, partial [Pirellulaceae bacterium]|nr:hypothetical protein [Pirellulaceae bacterium]
MARRLALGPTGRERKRQACAPDAGKAKSSPAKPSADEGQRLFLTLGCLACHQHGELGESGLFGGGDLTAIGAKRPQEFFARWLADPASLNRHHRMPVFDLSAVERDSLALWLGQQGKPAPLEQTGNVERGERLVAERRCAACHALPGAEVAATAPRLKPLSAASDWNRSCANATSAAVGQPRYGLAQADAQSLSTYYSAIADRVDASAAASPQSAGRDLLVELNCLACHAREGIDRQVHALPGGLEKHLAAVVALHDSLGKQVPAMTPPALNAVGDKLTDEALVAAIRREGKVHRPYLLARMPKFRLTDLQLASLVAYFTATDRIPERPEAEDSPRPVVAALAAAGPRLVTTDGFGCTSCHQVGSVLPDKAPLNARGPDLSMLEKRIRREWFGRWCAGPARIVPRMEMPSVQVPVRGVLGDNVHDQLAAVWHILNTPGFEPPEPNPVRVLRLSGVPEKKESPLVLHDVIKLGDRTHLFPVVIGLPNRHNILYDLETGRLAAWWLGDMARQRTKGKSWFWEAGGTPIFDPGFAKSELSLWIDGKERLPSRRGQHNSEINWFGGSTLCKKLTFKSEGVEGSSESKPTTVYVDVDEHLTAHLDEGGFTRTISIYGSKTIDKLRFRLVSEDVARQCRWDGQSKELTLPGPSGIVLKLIAPSRATWNDDGSILIHASDNRSNHLREHAFQLLPDEHWAKWRAFVEIKYSTKLSADRYPEVAVDLPSPTPARVLIAPGIEGVRLPLSTDIMPTGFAWSPDNELYLSSLKGQVFRATDKSGDGLEDRLETFADGLATPYGLFAARNHVDVITKTGLMRLLIHERSALGVQVIAKGWGATDDYHDWAVGLVPGDSGEYFIGLPCQQDQRNEAAAQYRGQLLKLVPRKRERNEFHEFDLE